MFIVNSYGLAVFLCILTMICWGSWANLQKLTQRESTFQLFYWDYSIGIYIIAIIFAFTLGSMGTQGRGFINDLHQGSEYYLMLAFAGGVIFNFANILLAAAIEIAGMSIAFPLALGLALVVGVIVNYIILPVGSLTLLCIGVFFILMAMMFSALAYRRQGSQKSQHMLRGTIVAIVCGIIMGFFFPAVASSMISNYQTPTPGKITPYTALFMFTSGLIACNLLINTILMYFPITEKRVTYKDYFTRRPLIHIYGMIAGFIWCVGMLFNLLAANKAGYAISYGLGQGATMIAAVWGVFIWHEFKNSIRPVTSLLTVMFSCYLLGLALIILARYG